MRIITKNCWLVLYCVCVAHIVNDQPKGSESAYKPPEPPLRCPHVCQASSPLCWCLPTCRYPYLLGAVIFRNGKLARCLCAVPVRHQHQHQLQRQQHRTESVQLFLTFSFPDKSDNWILQQSPLTIKSAFKPRKVTPLRTLTGPGIESHTWRPPFLGTCDAGIDVVDYSLLATVCTVR